MQDLRLPAMLLRQQQDHPPDTAAVQQHLKDLLHRDAAVFLEVGAPYFIPISDAS
jgi:hypothetical protein